jgi:predicted AlkP superfamily phosphohydrolase/phosphomutase
MRPRVLVIGLDMGDAGLVETWGRRGVLPALGSLLSAGASGRLRTTAALLHTSTWPTIFTGTLPGKHGVYYPYQPVPGVQQPRHVRPGQYGHPPFWALADRAGRRCVVVDAPETFPVEGFRGSVVFEWSTWAWYYTRATVPPELQGELRRRFGASPLRLEANRLGFAMPDVAGLASQLIAGARQKAQLVRWLMGDQPWDLFVVGFAEPHAGGHYLWPAHLGAPSEGLGVSTDTERRLGPLREVYEAVDRAVGELIAACDDDVTVLVVSGDGVGPNHVAWHLMPDVLVQAGFTVRPAAGSGDQARRPTLAQRARDLVPQRVRWAVSSRLPWTLRERLVSRLGPSVDWSRSKAFCLPADLEGCIRINVRGREPEGIVERGREYDDVSDDLTEMLLALVNPATGKPAVASVSRIAEAFPGDRADHLPDLTVRWNTDAEIHELASDRTGLVTAPPVDPRTGTHHPLGFVIARGPGIRPGTFPSGCHIADVAPTVLERLGVAPPPWMDGHPLPAPQGGS